MTSCNLARFAFAQDELQAWGTAHPRYRGWPVVYIINSGTHVYVGESAAVEARIRQHLRSRKKDHLDWVHVVLDDRFNKSACLDLESFLIAAFAGDGRLRVLNRNAGITNADYYDRKSYRKTFDGIFESLRAKDHLFRHSLAEIISSDLFKLSPFKALNHDQAIAVERIVEGLFEDLATGASSTAVVRGDPGTGKTVVAIYLLKLLQDIKAHDPEEPLDGDSVLNEFFTPEHTQALASLRIGIVVPQQSLRASISRVFARTPGLHEDLVLTPYEVGESETPFDLLVVDEAHRLNQRASQASGPLNAKFGEINRKLFGDDDLELTQLDWIKKQSTHTVLMLDPEQRVRPADLSRETTTALLEQATERQRAYRLRSQMRISAAQDYVQYVRDVLSDAPRTAPKRFEGYDLRFFTDLGQMRQEIVQRNDEHRLSRLVAGYAWKWRSRKDPNAFDIELDGEQLRWNSTPRDWISASDSVQEVGSIHTVQGYDLNYAGVIIGKDLRYDAVAERIVFDRAEYHDRKGRENNGQRGIVYTDDDLLEYVQNIYAVLLTRGILGTYVYVCDPELRKLLERYF